MLEHVKEELGREEPSPTLEKLLESCLSNVKASRSVMSKAYCGWDLQDQVYRGERTLDKDDVKEARQGKPTKMVVPYTHSQVMVFVSFLFLLFKQNSNPFELEPTGEEDYGSKWKDCEAVLKRDWTKSYGSRVLFQFLLDTARFGTAPLEVRWDKQTVKCWVAPEDPIQSVLGGVPVSAPQAPGYQEFLKFEGNVIRNVSPYRWFPDTTFPICDFEKGNFCFTEEDFTMGGLRQLEKDGMVHGVEHIEPPSAAGWGANGSWSDFRGGETRNTWGWDGRGSWDKDKDDAKVVVTKGRKKITPKNYLIGDKPLGEEEFPILYTIWYANDNRIIKLEECREWHQSFGSAVGQYTPDMHHSLTNGLADLIYRLQDVITWFVNSHITSVRRVINNRNIINPSLVDMTSYDKTDSDIFMRKGVGRMDPRMAVAQLPATDVTAGHMGDVDVLGKIMQMVTGVNEQMQGQYSNGRRDATQSRLVAAGSGGRMKMHGQLLWESGLGRVGSLMLSNSRQSLSQSSFARALGGISDPQKLMLRYAAFKGTPEEVIGADDYLGFDSTLQSEKGYMAQNLQELLGLILQADPQAAQVLTQSLSLKKVVAEMFYLRDGTPIERFTPDAEELQARQQAQAAQQQAEMQQHQMQMEQMAAQGQATQQQAQIKQAEGMQNLQLKGAEGQQKLSQSAALHEQKLRQAKQEAKVNGTRK